MCEIKSEIIIRNNPWFRKNISFTSFRKHRINPEVSPDKTKLTWREFRISEASNKSCSLVDRRIQTDAQDGSWWWLRWAEAFAGFIHNSSSVERWVSAQRGIIWNENAERNYNQEFATCTSSRRRRMKFTQINQKSNGYLMHLTAINRFAIFEQILFKIFR